MPCGHQRHTISRSFVFFRKRQPQESTLTLKLTREKHFGRNPNNWRLASVPAANVTRWHNSAKRGDWLRAGRSVFDSQPGQVFCLRYRVHMESWGLTNLHKKGIWDCLTGGWAAWKWNRSFMSSSGCVYAFNFRSLEMWSTSSFTLTSKIRTFSFLIFNKKVKYEL
jgi:hypothetical protein